MFCSHNKARFLVMTPRYQGALALPSTNSVDDWRAVTPGAGSYFNACDIEEPRWQHAFFGTNYERLLAIKRETGPWGVFYAPTMVCSADWVIAISEGEGFPAQNWRLCSSSMMYATSP
ncbi:Uu.00g121980.m01.CDS01 [Anthostomella pinea]|uniref:Uu.00g121980.m01.CDS01 n=1 Tax=Anthostomella pinea TaxID=933095 RepID=A0AAI8VH13_9PEZI|nr:Uu.00g121980.m01.CDS01 [Anthostomella pinea]